MVRFLNGKKKMAAKIVKTHLKSRVLLFFVMDFELLGIQNTIANMVNNHLWTIRRFSYLTCVRYSGHHSANGPFGYRTTTIGPLVTGGVR